MYGEERREAIIRLADDNRRVSVTGLAKTFAVTTETIRRDLAVLERRGALQRVHGGAIAIGGTGFEPELDVRARTMSDEKQRIAKAALDELPPEGSIFIEAGDTPSRLANMLPMERELTVVTNGTYIALALAERPNLTVMSVGGRVRRKTLACVDDWAVLSIAHLYVDVAFLGSNGVTVSRGLTTPDSGEAAVKRAMLGMARRTVLLVDHTKIGMVSLCRYGEVADIDAIITDDGLPSELADELRSAGPQLTIA